LVVRIGGLLLYVKPVLRFLHGEVLRVGRGRGWRCCGSLLVIERLAVFRRPFSVDFWSVRRVWR